MKKKTIIVLIALCIISCSSSKTIYFGPENNKISSEEFKALDNSKVRFLKIKSDTATIHLAIFLTQKQQRIDTIFANIIGPEYDNRKNTMIHLYSENTPKIEEDAKRERYWSWIKANSNIQAFLIGTKNSGVETNENMHIYLDRDNLLKDLFFENSTFNINHIYVKPSGEYELYYGEEDILAILDRSVGK